MALVTLPPSRRIDDAARRARPVALAHERALPLAGELGALVPGARLRRGSVTTVEGGLGSGATSVMLRLVAAATTAGEWTAAVDLAGTLGGLAAGEAGVVLERFAVVRRVPPARWSTVVAALLDGVGLVVADVPVGLRAGDARRLVARARERGTVLVAVGPWPAEAALHLRAEGSVWRGLGRGAGLLADRALHVQVEGRGAAVRGTVDRLAEAG